MGPIPSALNRGVLRSWQGGRGLLAIALAVATVLMVPFLDTVPGLDGDEAWAGLRARDVADGYFSVYGMNAYTGPLHQWLLLSLLETLGYHVWALRLFTVITSLLSVWLLFLIVRRLFDAQLAGIAALVLVSMPWFTLHGRTATESFALNPVLALAAVWCLLKSMDARDWTRGHLAGVAGVLLALGTWNHLLFLPVPLALALAAFEHARWRLFRSRTAAMVLFGFVVGALPRLIALLAAPQATQITLGGLVPAVLTGLPTRLVEWPGVFSELFHGDLLYRKYTGEVVWPTPPYAPSLFAVASVAIVGRLLTRTEPGSGRLKRVCAGFGMFAFLTLMIAPSNSDRYFLLVLYFGTFFLAALFRLLFRSGVSNVVGTIVLVSFVLFNVSRTTINFYAAHLVSGGKTSTFFIGSQGETSKASVRTDTLYQHLVQKQARDVYAEFYIVLPLRFYDLNRHQFRRLECVDIWCVGTRPRLPDDADSASSFVVSYLGGHNRISPGDFGAHELWTFQHFTISGFTRRQSGTSPSSKAAPPEVEQPQRGTNRDLEQESSSVAMRGDAW